MIAVLIGCLATIGLLGIAITIGSAMLKSPAERAQDDAEQAAVLRRAAAEREQGQEQGGEG